MMDTKVWRSFAARTGSKCQTSRVGQCTATKKQPVTGKKKTDVFIQALTGELLGVIRHHRIDVLYGC